jgi:hypothetical protein
MSFQAINWAWAVIEATPLGNGENELTDRQALILERIAHVANRSAICYPGNEALGASTRSDESTVTRALRKFEAMGLLTRSAKTQKGHRGRAYDTIKLNLGYAATPHASANGKPQQPRTPDGTNPAHQPQQPRTPVPRTNKGTDNGTDNGTDELRARARGKLRIDEDEVTDEELAIALAAMGAFNERNGSNLGLIGSKGKPTDALTRIVMRVREHPELAAEDHVLIVHRNFDAPWWKEPKLGGVGPIYGPKAWPRAMACDGVKRSERTVRRNVDRPGRRKKEPW